MAGCGKDLVAIAYSEFDKIIGPQLKVWYPQDSFRRETFDALSQYVIMDKEYCDRVVMVEIEEWNLLSWSSTVENPKYFRNSITFSFSFVLDKKADVQVYGRALKKIANTFVHMEIEHDFLSNPTTRAEISQIFKQFFDRLSTSSVAIFCHTSPSTSLKSFFNVALFRTPEVTIPQISDHQVPILINSYVDLSKLPGDVSLPHLVMHIDGVSHIKKLAREVDMDINYVKKSLLLLQHHKVVILSDLFKFSNIYKMVSDQSIEMLAVPEVEQEMMMFVVNATYLPYYMNEPTSAATPIPHPMNHPTSPSEIPSYALLCSAIISLITDLHPAHTVAQIVIKQKQKFVDNIFKYYDLVRLLAYLQYKEIVTRVNEYPVYMGQNLNPSVTDTQSLLNLNDDLASHRYPPSGMLTHEALESSHRFQRLTRKTTNKSIFSGQTLNLHHGHHGHHHGSSLPTLSPEVVLNQVIRYLDGSECLDYICCKFEINHLDIINHPQVSIIYK